MASLTSKFRGYRVQTVLHVFLLLAAALIFCYALLNNVWLPAVVLSAGIIVIVAARIIIAAEKNQESFSQFINHIAHNDFSSTTAPRGSAGANNNFLQAQKTLIDKYKKLKAEKSAQHEYLHMVIEHVDTALLCFDDSGKMVIANRAAKELLQSSSLVNIVQVDAINKHLGAAMRNLNPGKSLLLKSVIHTETMQLLLAARDFKLLGKDHKLVSIQNIQATIDETEIASWQKLIKVLTHEIMNSMTPIVTLSKHLQNTVTDNHESDTSKAIRAISSRSEGLLQFVESYRSLSNLPSPLMAEVAIAELFDHIRVLTAEQFAASGSQLQVSVAPIDLTFLADRNQLEQIMLNLIRNALDALESQPVRDVFIDASLDHKGRPVVQVRDTGCGISPAQLSEIFTPFFTTKASGSGIGLSLSRQLARLNQSSLDVQSNLGQGSTFTLVFDSDRRVVL